MRCCIISPGGLAWLPKMILEAISKCFCWRGSGHLRSDEAPKRSIAVATRRFWQRSRGENEPAVARRIFLRWLLVTNNSELTTNKLKMLTDSKGHSSLRLWGVFWGKLNDEKISTYVYRYPHAVS